MTDIPGYSGDLSLKWLAHLDSSHLDARLEYTAYYSLMATVPTAQSSLLTAAINKISFPPRTAHLLQPLDIVVLQPFKHCHAERVEQATRSGCSDFNKVEFLYSIREQTFKNTPSSAHSGKLDCCLSLLKSFLSSCANSEHQVLAQVPPTHHLLSDL